MKNKFTKAQKIVKDHYGLSRYPSTQDCDLEIANLKRKGMLYLDDKQFRLASAFNSIGIEIPNEGE